MHARLHRRWPWALNVAGLGVYPRTRTEAEAVLSRVGLDVDIVYAQINYRTWGRPIGLRKLDLLEPWRNLALAAVILRQAMEREPGSWLGIGRYHSATPWRKVRYGVQVARVYQALEAQRGLATRAATDHRAAYAAGER